MRQHEGAPMVIAGESYTTYEQVAEAFGYTITSYEQAAALYNEWCHTIRTEVADRHPGLTVQELIRIGNCVNFAASNFMWEADGRPSSCTIITG